MKWLVFILLLITTVATFVPCCQDNCDEGTTETSHRHEENGACSPLNSCATCTGSVQLVKDVVLMQPCSEKLQHNEATIAFYLHTYSGSFWQPPKTVS